MLRRSVLYLLFSFVALSCSNATGPDSFVGTWCLQKVSDQLLPYTLEESTGRKVELTGETVTLIASGRQTMVTSFRVTTGGIVSVESVPAPGNYTVNGSTLLLTFDDDESIYTATIKGDTMTINDMGLTFVYRRD